MKYIMKSGILYDTDATGQLNQPLARLKGQITGMQKIIQSMDGGEKLFTDIRYLSAPQNQKNRIQYHRYILYNREGRLSAEGKPAYAKGEDPSIAGWPVYRMPRVDHAEITIQDHIFHLKMQNSQNYLLTDSQNSSVLQIIHHGITGGWDFKVTDIFDPYFLCGIFAFCRYLEQENEFITV